MTDPERPRASCSALFGERTPMLKHPEERDFPVGQVRRYLEPGPIVLVSSRWAGQSNIMTLGWHTVLEFTPSLVGCMVAGGNQSFHMIRNSRECVIKWPKWQSPVTCFAASWT